MKQLAVIYVELALLPFILIERLFKKKLVVSTLLHLLRERLAQKINVDGIWFSADEPKVAGRGVGLRTKEPDTIHWIDSFVGPDEIFYDIGANVGVFSLYVAKFTKAAQVYSFEPESSNYYYLNKNIYFNQFDGRVTAFNIALNDSKLLSCLNLSAFVPGSSEHNFHEERNQNHQAFRPSFKQGVLGVSLDELISEYGLKKPHHIKIDVDGNEHKIIEGMKETLKDPGLKSVAIELNQSLEADKKIIQTLVQSGFKQIEDNPKLVNERYRAKGWPYNLYFKR